MLRGVYLNNRPVENNAFERPASQSRESPSFVPFVRPCVLPYSTMTVSNSDRNAMRFNGRTTLGL
jgi:hypothetical protein